MKLHTSDMHEQILNPHYMDLEISEAANHAHVTYSAKTLNPGAMKYEQLQL